MTTARKPDKRGEKQHLGEGGVSNAAGIAIGPGRLVESRSEQDGVHAIVARGSPKTAWNRPRHKANP